MMLDAYELRVKYNQKTPWQQAMESIHYCIEQAAQRGERQIKYRWPFFKSGFMYDCWFILALEDEGYRVFDGNCGNLWDDDTLYISW